MNGGWLFQTSIQSFFQSYQLLGFCMMLVRRYFNLSISRVVPCSSWFAGVVLFCVHNSAVGCRPCEYILSYLFSFCESYRFVEFCKRRKWAVHFSGGYFWCLHLNCYSLIGLHGWWTCAVQIAYKYRCNCWCWLLILLITSLWFLISSWFKFFTGF